MCAVARGGMAGRLPVSSVPSATQWSLFLVQANFFMEPCCLLRCNNQAAAFLGFPGKRFPFPFHFTNSSFSTSVLFRSSLNILSASKSIFCCKFQVSAHGMMQCPAQSAALTLVSVGRVGSHQGRMNRLYICRYLYSSFTSSRFMNTVLEPDHVLRVYQASRYRRPWS